MMKRLVIIKRWVAGVLLNADLTRYPQLRYQSTEVKTDLGEYCWFGL